MGYRDRQIRHDQKDRKKTRVKNTDLISFTCENTAVRFLIHKISKKKKIVLV